MFLVDEVAKILDVIVIPSVFLARLDRPFENFYQA